MHEKIKLQFLPKRDNITRQVATFLDCCSNKGLWSNFMQDIFSHTLHKSSFSGGSYELLLQMWFTVY
jgi:hypothetical protein